MMTSRSLIQLLLLTGLILSKITVFAQDNPTPQQVLQKFDISAAQIEQLENGKIVSYDISETSQKELAIGLAIIIPTSLANIIDYIKHSNLTDIESDVIATGNLTENTDIMSFKKFAFSTKQLDEAKAFLEAEPGDDFNLSKQELDNLQSLRPGLKNADNKTLLTTANQKYRDFLSQRFQAYRKTGLSGVAVYNRKTGDVDPGSELRTDATNSKTWSSYFPELQLAWLNYPAPLPANASEQFLWINHRTEDRPTAILVHRVMLVSQVGGIIVSRQYYVGHSYNSSHVVAGGLPYKNGTLVFYSTRLSTDQVAGMGSGLKHSIGREEMKEEMIKRLQRINNQWNRSAAAVVNQD